MTNIKKVAVYIRVSTEMQDAHGSLEIQEIKMREYCENQGFQIYKIYSDVMSGTSTKRKSFIELEKALSLKLFDAIVVWAADRLSRSLLQRLTFFNEMNKHRIAFISATEPQLSTTTPEGRLMLNVTGAMAEHERELISKRTKSSSRKRAEQNKYMGGGIPFGYSVVDTKYIINDSEAITMKSVFREILKKRSVLQVSKEHNLPYNSLLERLKNPIYAGGLRYSKRVKNLQTGVRESNQNYQITWGIIPEIIPRSEWDLIQEILRNNKKKFTGQKSLNKYLYSGLLYCFCGGKMAGNKIKKNIFHYRCEHCKKSINTKVIDPLIYNELFDNDKIKALNTTSFDNFEFLEEIDQITKKISNLKKRKDDLAELFLDGFISKDKLKEDSRKIDIDISSNNKKLSQLNDKINRLKTLDTKIDNLEALKFILNNRNDETAEELKEILNLIVNKINIISYKPLIVEIVI